MNMYMNTERDIADRWGRSIEERGQQHLIIYLAIHIQYCVHG